MKKGLLKTTIYSLIIFIFLNLLFLFFPLLAGINRESSRIEADELSSVIESDSVEISSQESSCGYEKENPSSTSTEGSFIEETEEDIVDVKEEKETSGGLTCKIYNEVETEDFKIYEKDEIVRVEVKGDHADSAVDYLRSEGCEPLASSNIVYIINGEEIRL